MIYYYVYEGDKQLGPFLKEELIKLRISKKAMIWREGLNKWVEASELDELSDITISLPPPIKNTNDPIDLRISRYNSNFDYSYGRFYSATIVGILLLFIRVVIVIAIQSRLLFQSSHIIVYLCVSILVSIIAAFWVMNMAFKLNRSQTLWGILAFLAPDITLIVVGLLRKLKINYTIDENLPKSEKINKQYQASWRYYDNERYHDCLNSIANYETTNDLDAELIRLKALANYKLQNYFEAEKSFKVLLGWNLYLREAYYYLGFIELSKDNIENAISSWRKAEENGHLYAEDEIIRYGQLYGKYHLTKEEVNAKLDMKISLIGISGVKYHSDTLLFIGEQGIFANKLNADGSYVKLYMNDKGLLFKVKKNYCGFLYREIGNFSIDIENKEWKIVTFNNKYLIVSFKTSHPYLIEEMENVIVKSLKF